MNTRLSDYCAQKEKSILMVITIAAGGFVIATDATLEPEWSETWSANLDIYGDTSQWPDGRYRFYVEYKEVGPGDVIQEVEVTFGLY